LVFAEISYLRKISGEQRSIKAANVVIAILAPLVWIFGSTGFLIFLKSFSPAAPHFFIGFGGLLTSALILIVRQLENWNWGTRWQFVLLVPIAYELIFFAAVYGNALKEQKLYEARIGSRLSVCLAQLEQQAPFREIVVQGSVGIAPVVHQAAATRFHLLNRIVEIQLSTTSGFCGAVLRYFGIYTPVHVLATSSPAKSATASSAAVSSDPNFEITRAGDVITLSLRPLPPP
jgi:hypothetical protein